MRTTLTRGQYEAYLNRKAGELLPLREAAKLLACQYPKGTDEALRELWFRGVDARRLPEDQGYWAAQLDAFVEAAETCGWLTDEAEIVRAHGLTLLRYREALVDPGSPENLLDLPV
jgi:hypothetical protein